MISNGNIVGVGSGLCLDGLGGGNSSGTRIGLWTCTDAVNEIWRITSSPLVAPAVTVNAESRCISGKAYVVTTLRNDGPAPVAATVKSGYGEKSFTEVAPDRSVSTTMNSRIVAIPAGQVTTTVTTGTATSTTTSSYLAIACRRPSRGVIAPTSGSGGSTHAPGPIG